MYKDDAGFEPGPLSEDAEASMARILEETRQIVLRRAWSKSRTGTIERRDIADAYEWFQNETATEAVFRPRRSRKPPSERKRSGANSNYVLLGLAVILLITVLSVFFMSRGDTGLVFSADGVTAFASIVSGVGATLFAFMRYLESYTRRVSRETASLLGESGGKRDAGATFLSEWLIAEALVGDLAKERVPSPEGDSRMRPFGVSLLGLQNEEIISPQLGSDLRALVGIRNELVHGGQVRIKLADRKLLRRSVDALEEIHNNLAV
jgi:hypothetical protein